MDDSEDMACMKIAVALEISILTANILYRFLTTEFVEMCTSWKIHILGLFDWIRKKWEKYSKRKMQAHRFVSTFFLLSGTLN